MLPVYISTNDDELCCPHCGGYNLHQGTVQVFNRRAEDLPPMAVLIPVSGAPIQGDPESNPSPRRNGLAIGFMCENCGNMDENKTLVIFQHKGSTYIRWEE